MSEKQLWSFLKNKNGFITITDYLGTGINVKVPDVIDGCKVTEIGDFAFSPNAKNISKEQKRIRKRIKTIVLPECIISIGESAFYGCENLAGISLPAGITHIGQKAFLLNYKLTGIQVSENNTKYASVDGILYNKNKDRIVFIPGGIRGSISLPDNMSVIRAYDFYGLSNIENIIIPDSVVEIKKYAFAECENLTKLVIPCSVTKIEKSVFKGCTNLEKVIFENKDLVIQKNWFDYSFIEKIIDNVYPGQLSHELKVEALPYVIKLLLGENVPGVNNSDKEWKDAWIKYFSRIRKSIYTEIIEKSDLLKLMIKEKLLDLHDVKALIKMATEKNYIEVCAGLLEYENNNFTIEEIVNDKVKDVYDD